MVIFMIAFKRITTSVFSLRGNRLNVLMIIDVGTLGVIKPTDQGETR